MEKKVLCEKEEEEANFAASSLFEFAEKPLLRLAPVALLPAAAWEPQCTQITT